MVALVVVLELVLEVAEAVPSLKLLGTAGLVAVGQYPGQRVSHPEMVAEVVVVVVPAVFFVIVVVVVDSSVVTVTSSMVDQLSLYELAVGTYVTRYSRAFSTFKAP